MPQSSFLKFIFIPKTNPAGSLSFLAFSMQNDQLIQIVIVLGAYQHNNLYSDWYLQNHLLLVNITSYNHTIIFTPTWNSWTRRQSCECLPHHIIFISRMPCLLTVAPSPFCLIALHTRIFQRKWSWLLDCPPSVFRSLFWDKKT